MRKETTILLLIMPLLQAATQLPDPSQIMNRSRELALSGNMSSTIYLSITEKNGSVRNRIIAMNAKSFPDGSEKRMIRFLEPADVRGTSLLIVDNKNSQDEMWIHLPALKKTRRLVTSEKSKSFMSSEFSNSDMTSPALADFNNKHFSGSGENKQWIIESIPVSTEKADEYGYTKKISWLDQETFRVKKMEFYNFNNQLFKVIDIRGIKTVGNDKYIVSDMKVSNPVNGRSSEIKISNIVTNVTIPDEEFSVQGLER
jgi:hypothetical protein